MPYFVPMLIGCWLVLATRRMPIHGGYAGHRQRSGPRSRRQYRQAAALLDRTDGDPGLRCQLWARDAIDGRGRFHRVLRPTDVTDVSRHADAQAFHSASRPEQTLLRLQNVCGIARIHTAFGIDTSKTCLASGSRARGGRTSPLTSFWQSGPKQKRSAAATSRN